MTVRGDIGQARAAFGAGEREKGISSAHDSLSGACLCVECSDAEVGVKELSVGDNTALGW